MNKTINELKVYIEDDGENDCIECELSEENRCCDCCRDWDEDED